jgi:nitroimidazol reductase NimA-like FMN-containing flavoprotein (pyridoxamine 5'-phosphate oxidase superfamily)
MNEEQLRQEIATILNTQHLAVLATVRDGQPYTSLMAFAHTPDLGTLIVATDRGSRKHVNLLGEPRVSLLIDTRAHSATDFQTAAAVTVIGDAAEASTTQRSPYEKLFLARHPSLTKFLLTPATALIVVTVRHYLLVNRFQQTMELHLTAENGMFGRGV